MTLDEILEMWEKDSIVDALELGDASIITSKMHSKYLAIMAKHKMITQSYDIKYKERRIWKQQYLRGDYNDPESVKKYNIEPTARLYANVEIKEILDSDNELNEILIKKMYNEQIVSVCEFILKELHNRTFAIGNAIKYNIFKGGG